MDSSPFARLSPELRNAIWGLTLATGGDMPYSIDAKTPLQAALCRTCRQIRNETQLIFYATTEFRLCIHTIAISTAILDTQAALYCLWLDTIGTKYSKVVKGITFHFQGIPRLLVSDFFHVLGLDGAMEGVFSVHHLRTSYWFATPDVEVRLSNWQLVRERRGG